MMRDVGAFPEVKIGVDGQGVLAGTVGPVSVRIINKGGRWMAGIEGATPTLDVTKVIHDNDKLAQVLRGLV